MKGNFSYYYGYEGEQYSFYRIPKLLMTDEQFQSVSVEAKLLYGMLLDRMALSAKNDWIDDQGRVFIVFSLEEVMTKMGCKSQKATKLFAELDGKKGVGLIERVNRGQGKPSVIYVKNFSTVRPRKTKNKKENGIETKD